MVVLLVNAAAACFMAGVSWLVSLVVYPAFAEVGAGSAESWSRYHAAHSARIVWVVLPPMLVELAASGWLAVRPPLDGVPAGLAWAGFATAAGTWALTAFVAAGDHARLERGWDARVAARLLRRHHARTALWSAHAVLACLLIGAVAA